MGSITFRLSDTERETIRHWADSEGRTIGDTIRRRLFAENQKTDSFQVEHLATDAAHRPVPQALEVRNATTGVRSFNNLEVENNYDKVISTTTTTTKPQSWMERNQSQTSRDEILRGINKKGKP